MSLLWLLIQKEVLRGMYAPRVSGRHDLSSANEKRLVMPLQNERLYLLEM